MLNLILRTARNCHRGTYDPSNARGVVLRFQTLRLVGIVGATKLLLDRGADVNTRAALDPSGIGGQTPIFHAVSQFGDWVWPVAELLLDRGADLTVTRETSWPLRAT
jgi:hypothetical protein